MFQFSSDRTIQTRSNVRGGTGDLTFSHVFSPEQLGNRASMFAVITLRPGESIGIHSHDTNGEAYLILSGRLMVTDDGVEKELCPGDAEFCADGHTHGVRNHTKETASFLAVIIDDR